MTAIEKKEIKRHGGPYDRGSADAHYDRPAVPHYFVGDTYMTPKVKEEDMTAEQINLYMEGYESYSNG